MAGTAVAQSTLCVSDELLAAAAASGDRKAFDALVERYRDVAYAYALARLGSREEAEDVVQEAFVRALVSLNRFRADGLWGAWLMRIVRNLCHDCLRRRRVRSSVALHEGWLDSAPGPEMQTLFAERRDELVRAIAAMPELLRTPLLMHYASRRTYREIALALSTPESTAIGRVAGALRFLRKRMAELR
jgi:RNA polymerase sigma-70 factor (ECF subfamily)